MQFTRRQILDSLRRNQISSVPELSKVLNLTVGNIRHHIKDLEAQGIIEVVGNLPASGRGRPTLVYSLTQEAEDHNLDGLSNVLLEVLTKAESSESTIGSINQIAGLMTADFNGDVNPIQRLNKAIAWLNERHYRARWEASPTGPRIILNHCPYSAIQLNSPELCMMDNTILTRLTSQPMEPVSIRNNDPFGIRHCVFAARIISSSNESLD